MIIYLIGTKAQYIKMAPVVLETIHRNLPFRLVYSGQHSETFDDLQANFGMPDPDFVLVSGEEAKDHLSFSGWLLKAIRAVRAPAGALIWKSASFIVVHGDTASALLGAWIGRRFRIPVAHVEAGLRSFSYFDPFPEELIRVLVSRVTAVHFCPDSQSLANLDKAGVRGDKVMTHGNTLKDSLRLAFLRQPPAERPSRPYAVFSMHRHENLFNKSRLNTLLEVLKEMTKIVDVRFVLHPVTRKRLSKLGFLEELGRVEGLELVPRMDFFRFVGLISRAAFVATDGGSNQEECAMLGIPCVLLRQATERMDGLGGDGSVMLSNYDTAALLAFARKHATQAGAVRPIEQGSPSSEIVDRLAGS